MSLKVVVLTRTFRPSGAQMVWRLLRAGFEPIVLVEKREKMMRWKKNSIWALWKQHGFHFLLKRFVEMLRIKRRYFLRKFFSRRFESPIFLSIEELALTHKFTMYEVEDHNDAKTAELLRQYQPDIGILTNTRRIHKEILEIPKHGFLNLHLSKLPQYAGLDSIFWALYNGEKEIGVTVHRADEKIDRGEIILQCVIPISPLDTEESLYQKALWLGTYLMVKAVMQVDIGCAKAFVQDLNRASYFSWPTRRERAVLRSRMKEQKAQKLFTSDKIQVLHIVTRLTRGGAQENTVATVRGLMSRGYRVILVTGLSWGKEGEILAEALESGMEIVILPELIREVYWVKDLIAFWKLGRMMGRVSFQIVHTHMSKAGLLGRCIARMSQVPLIIHTPHGHVFHSYFPAYKERMFLILERWVAKICQCLISLTDKNLAEHLELGVGRRDQWVTIPSGVNEALFQDLPAARKREIRDAWRIPLGYMVVGFVGRLAPVKGAAYFVEAMPAILAKVPSTYFLIVGDGEEKQRLESRVRELHLASRVIFTGDQKQVTEFLSIMDILTVPSLNEGMGRVIVEAGLLRKAVVATNVSGIPDLIRANRTGLLVEARNPQALAEAVARLLTDTLLSIRLGENLYKHVFEGYTEAYMVKKIHELYQALLKEKGFPIWDDVAKDPASKKVAASETVSLTL